MDIVHNDLASGRPAHGATLFEHYMPADELRFEARSLDQHVATSTACAIIQIFTDPTCSEDEDEPEPAPEDNIISNMQGAHGPFRPFSLLSRDTGLARSVAWQLLGAIGESRAR